MNGSTHHDAVACIRILLATALFCTLLVTIASAAEVTFRFRPDGGALSVTVAGYFNEWSLSADPLSDPDGDGTWERTVDLAPGRHPYKFVVDGSVWITDAAAPEFEDDGFGGKNSVLLVENAPLIVTGVPAEASLGADGAVVAKDTAVRFRFRPDGEVKFVSVAGTFNDWSTSASPMNDPDRDGIYETVFRLTPGRHLYKFVVDGNSWFTDEAASAFEDDGFGGQNSVLEVGRVAVVAGEPISGDATTTPIGPVVTFRFAPGSTADAVALDPVARRKRVNAVSVAGSFNGWNAAAHPMSDLDGDGIWEVRFRLPSGEYSYQFVIDGDIWATDPHAQESEEDGFGGRRSRFSIGTGDVTVGTPTQPAR